MPHALIVDDHTEQVIELANVFRKRGFSVDTAVDPKGARDSLLREMPDVALINIELGDTDSQEEAFRLLNAGGLSNVAEVYLATTSPSYRSAARGMRLGASDYFALPDDLPRLDHVLGNYLKEFTASADPDCDQVHKSGRGLLIGESPPMQRLYKIIRKVAPTPATVLLAGESGSGKELVAQTLHQLSERAEKPFVAMNCGAISGQLTESELFGHVKGAFTGAARNHRGYFERADGGTLFLDEVTEMELDLQVKLLRVLEARSFRRVGGEKDYKTDVRIIASTNRDPEEAVDQGVLREDLYYRLAEFPIRIPPLRERGDDVLLLAEAFLEQNCSAADIQKTFDEKVMEALRLHNWPGNVRELKNIVARAFILAGDTITTDDLPGKVPNGSDMGGDYMRISVGHTLADVERRMIFATLEHFDNDKKAAAEVLGISLKTLYNRLKKYHLG